MICNYYYFFHSPLLFIHNLSSSHSIYKFVFDTDLTPKFFLFAFQCSSRNPGDQPEVEATCNKNTIAWLQYLSSNIIFYLVYMLRSKLSSDKKNFKLGWFSITFVSYRHVALTINFCELGIADKENWESTYVN